MSSKPTIKHVGTQLGFKYKGRNIIINKFSAQRMQTFKQMVEFSIQWMKQTAEKQNLDMSKIDVQLNIQWDGMATNNGWMSQGRGTWYSLDQFSDQEAMDESYAYLEDSNKDFNIRTATAMAFELNVISAVPAAAPAAAALKKGKK